MSLSETITGAGVVVNATSGYHAYVAVHKELHHLKNPELEKVLVKDLDLKTWGSLTPDEKASYNAVALYLALQKKKSEVVKAQKKTENPEKKTSGFFLYAGEQRVKAQNEEKTIPTSKKLGEMWHELSDAEKKEYKKRAENEAIPSIKKESVPDDRPRCSGTTQKNQQCSRRAVEDGLCKQHHAMGIVGTK